MLSKKLIAAGAFVLCCCSAAVAQIGGGDEPDPILLFATNNSGFIQNGIGGADNLVLFELIPLLPDKKTGEEPEAVFMPFTVIGDLSSGQDLDGNGVDDSLGSFSGLEWSLGIPGQGTLVGCVLNDGEGSGQFYQINPNSGQPSLIGPGPVDGKGQQLAFSDLAFNPSDNRMYGLMNDITVDKDGTMTIGDNSLWRDTNGDLIPDFRIGQENGGIIVGGGGRLQTLASGLAFDAMGAIYIYDSLQNRILAAAGTWDCMTFPGVVNAAIANSFNPKFLQDYQVANFANNGIDLASSESIFGNGLAAIDSKLIIGSDVEGENVVERDTIVSFYDIPCPLPPPPLPLPAVYPATKFVTQFSQTGFFSSVAPGDLVCAMSDLSGLPPTFPDGIIVNNGTPAKDATLESVVLSDNLRYCITAEPPTSTSPPVDLTFVFTIPNAANLTLLGLEIESQTNAPSIEHSINIFNVNTNLFEEVESADVTVNTDGDIVVDLTFSISDYVNTSNGTLVCRIGSLANSPTTFFPWQIKYNSVLAVSE